MHANSKPHSRLGCSTISFRPPGSRRGARPDRWARLPEIDL